MITLFIMDFARPGPRYRALIADGADLQIRCSCGALRGAVRSASPTAGNRGFCYCDDCQAFAYFLGRAADILDHHGGTEIYQTSQGSMELDAGVNRLACMRRSSKGLLRWYADCCNTPIGNTLSSTAIPFVGLIHRCLVRPSGDPTLNATLGPSRHVSAVYPWVAWSVSGWHLMHLTVLRDWSSLTRQRSWDPSRCGTRE
jgi:hypothetical protein